MCTLIRCNGDCAPAKSSTSFLGELTGVAVVAVAKAVWKLAELLLVGLIAATVWTAPRAWRLTVRVTRAGWARWQASRPVTGQIEPAPPRPAITDLPDGHVRWSDIQRDLRAKKEANA
jgi:hypothetical protein